MITNLIVERINMLCKEKNLTLNQLAKKSYLTQSTIQSIMNKNSKNPKIETIIMICYGLNITLQEFFSDKIFQNVKIEYIIK